MTLPAGFTGHIAVDGDRVMNLSYAEALRIVQERLWRSNESDPSGPRAVWKTEDTGYGWAFVVQDERFVKTLDSKYKRIGGSHCLLVTKVDKRLHMLPAIGRTLSDSLRAWEAGEGATYLANDPARD